MSFREINRTDLGELIAASESLNSIKVKESESQVELYLALIKSIGISVGNAVARAFGGR